MTYLLYGDKQYRLKPQQVTEVRTTIQQILFNDGMYELEVEDKEHKSVILYISRGIPLALVEGELLSTEEVMERNIANAGGGAGLSQLSREELSRIFGAQD